MASGESSASELKSSHLAECRFNAHLAECRINAFPSCYSKNPVTSSGDSESPNMPNGESSAIESKSSDLAELRTNACPAHPFGYFKNAMTSSGDSESANMPCGESSASELKSSDLLDMRTNACPIYGSDIARGDYESPNMLSGELSAIENRFISLLGSNFVLQARESECPDSKASSTEGLSSSAGELPDSKCNESSSSTESLHSESFESSNSELEQQNQELSESQRKSLRFTQETIAAIGKLFKDYSNHLSRFNNCSESLSFESSNREIQPEPVLRESKDSESLPSGSEDREIQPEPVVTESKDSESSDHEIQPEPVVRESKDSESSDREIQPEPVVRESKDSESSDSEIQPEPVARKSEESKECENPELINEENNEESSSESHETVWSVSDKEGSDAKPSEATESNSEVLDSTYTEGPYSLHYCHLKLLRKGTFGCVSKAFRKSDGLLVATKFIKKSKIFNDVLVHSDKLQKEVPIELSLLLSFDHPNIVKVHDVFENDNYYHLVMEIHGCGMDLFDFINRSTSRDEPIVCYIFKQIVSAVSFLHSNNIVHRDLKGENCLIDENFHAKLIDFGSAGIMTDKPFKKFYGTKYFCSPEVMRGEKYRGPELEMFSLGVMCYDLAFGEIPFAEKEDILTGKYVIPAGASEGLVELIQGMLEPEPDHRLTLPEIEINKWVNQDVEIKNYSFADIVGASEEELNLDKYISIANLTELADEDIDLPSVLESIKKILLDDNFDHLLVEDNTVLEVSPDQKDNV